MSNGFTVQDYLNKKRQENPQKYGAYRDVTLYEKLRNEGESVPSWDYYDSNQSQKNKQQKYYERKQNPDFVNGLFDWTDWGIDEGSAGWVKSAYNNSITGMSYQLYNGESKFDLSAYNPGIVEDVLSGVLSFMMPLDMLTMAVGGALGKGVAAVGGNLAKEGAKRQMVNNLMKGGVKGSAQKLTRKEAMKHVSKYAFPEFVEKNGLGAVLQASSPVKYAGVLSGATMATFEGTMGGLMAANNGDDVWQGIGRGVMHGGILGGLSGLAGAGLNLRHAKLLNKAKKEGTESLTGGMLGQRAQLALTGTAGEIGVEGAVFTLEEIPRMYSDEDYTMRDMLRSLAVNVGMMGVLKAKTKYVDKNVKPLWEQGKEQLKEYYDRYNETDGKNADANRKAFDNVEDATTDLDAVVNDSDTMVDDVTSQSAADELRDIVNQARDEVDVTFNDEKVWELRFDDITQFIKAKNTDKLSKMTDGGEKVLEIKNQIDAVYEAINKNLEHHENNAGNLTQTEKDAIVSKYKKLKNDWETEIIEPLTDMEVIKDANSKDTFDPFEIRAEYGVIKKYIEDTGDTSSLDIIHTENKPFLKDGELDFDSPDFRYKSLKKRLDAYRKASKIDEPSAPTGDLIPLQAVEGQRKFDEEIIEQKLPALLESTDDILAKRRGTPESRKPLEKFLKANQKIQEKEFGKPGSKERAAYKKSKGIIAFIAKKYGQDIKVGGNAGTQLGHINKLAEFLAADGKSILDMTNTDLKNFILSKKGDNVKAWTFNKYLIPALQNLSSIYKTNKYGNIEIFDLSEFDILQKQGEPLNEQIKNYIDERKGLEKREGFITTNAEMGPTRFNEESKTIIVSTKKGQKELYLTESTMKKLMKLNERVMADPAQSGHEDFLIRDTKGEALTKDDMNYIMEITFGKVKGAKHPPARLFRNSLSRWLVVNKNKGIINKEQANLIDKLVIGHEQDNTMLGRYGDINKVEKQKEIESILKMYRADIANEKINIGKKGEGYSTKQIREGLEVIDSWGSDIQFSTIIGKKDGKPIYRDRYINKETLQTIVDYMIESGPRINEIVPTKEMANAWAKEKAAKKSFQLETDIKAAEETVSMKELRGQVAWASRVSPELIVDITKKDLGKHEGEYVLGKITGHLVEIATGRAKADTLPHEVSHRVVDVLSASGGKGAKLVKEGIKMFGSEEALVEAVGKYTLGRLRGQKKITNMKFYGGKTMFGKMRNFVSRAVNHLRNFFGIRNVKDANRVKTEITSLIGEKVYKGDYAKFMPFEKKVNYQKQNSSTSAGMKLIKKINARIKAKGKDGSQMGAEANAIENGLTIKEMNKIREEAFGYNKLDKKGSYKLNDVTVENLEKYESLLNNYVDSKMNNQTGTAAINEIKISEMEIARNVSIEARDKYFDDYYNTTFEKATDEMIDAYREQLILQPKVEDMSQTFTNKLIMSDSGMDFTTEFSPLKRAVMRTGEVLEKWGGKPGKVIAKALRKHDFYRTQSVGKANEAIDKIQRLLPKEVLGTPTKAGFMDFIDPDISNQAIKELKDLKKKYPNSKMIDKRLKAAESVATKFRTNQKFKDARKIWKELSDYYYENLIVEASAHTRGRNKLEIKKMLNQKYLDNYFVKKLTPEALKGLSKDNESFLSRVDDTIKSIKDADLIKIADKLVKKQDIDSKKSVEYQEVLSRKGDILKNHVADELYNMMIYGPGSKTVKPFFLKERTADLPYMLEVKTAKGKKLVKTYESSIDTTIGYYGYGMGKFLATVKYFPEFTELGRSLQINAGTKRDILRAFEERNNKFGAYALQAIEQQLGLDYKGRDSLNEGYHKIAGTVTSASAWMGLSSPLSGIKNFLIQIPRNVSLYGTRNTFKAMSNGFKTRFDPVKYQEAIRKGYVGYGLKQVLSEAPGIKIGKKELDIKWWFENVNLMGESENFNRIVAAEASKMHFNNLVSKLRGESSMFFPGDKPPEIMRMFEDTFYLSKKQIDFLKNGKDIFETNQYQDILGWVAHQGHKAAAGATATVDLPLWMQNKYSKPFTLFSRIATSVTIDSYKNYLVPMKNGNFAPVIKASIGHGLTGAALYAIYDTFLGQQAPTEDSPAIDRMMSYLWRGEALGVFGEVLSPHDKQNMIPIMEPIILRNAMTIGEELMNVFKTGKSVTRAMNDATAKTIVAYGQAKKMFESINHPYVRDYKRIKTLEKQWRKNMGVGYTSPQVLEGLSTPRQHHYWKLKESIMFGKTDAEIARNYYVALNTVMQELESGGIVSKRERIKLAKSYIRRVLKKMSPLSIPNKNKYRNKLESKRTEFLNSLSSDNRAMAKRIEKEYEYKMRNLDKILANRKWRELYSIYPY